MAYFTVTNNVWGTKKVLASQLNVRVCGRCGVYMTTDRMSNCPACRDVCRARSRVYREQVAAAGGQPEEASAAGVASGPAVAPCDEASALQAELRAAAQQRGERDTAAEIYPAKLRAAAQHRDERLAAAEATIAKLRAAAKPEIVDLTPDDDAKPPLKRRRVAASGGGGGGLALAAQVTTQLVEAKLRKGEAEAAAEEARTAVAAAEAQLEAEQDRHLCPLCEVEPLTVVCLPCRHFTLCATCAKDKRATANGCPMCRNPITELLSVYQPR